MLIKDQIFYVEKHFVDKPLANIIITHGIAQHSGYYQSMTKTLNEANFNVILYDVRGHGRTQTKSGDVKDFFEFVGDLHVIVSNVKEFSSLPIFLIGHSMGGVIVSAYAIKYHDVAGVIVASAPTNTPKAFKGLPGAITAMMPQKRIKTNFDDPNLSYKSRQLEIDPYALKNFTIRLGRQILIVGVGYINQHLKNFELPVLFIHGDDDIIVSKQEFNQFYQRLPNPKKDNKIYPNTKHNVFYDLETDRIVKDLIAWINKQITPVSDTPKEVKS